MQPLSMLTTRFVFICCFCGVLAQFSYQPEQVHINYGNDPSQMVVTWVTMTAVNQSLVWYGRHELTSLAKGDTTIFTDGGAQHRKMEVHRVIINDLIPGKVYYYRCGSDFGWSVIYSFKAMPSGTRWNPRFAIYGDLGNENAQSLPRLQEETGRGIYDAILHVGDMAYNMETNDALVGDAFMRQIEPIAAYVPYMTCVGNHESAYNFSNYVGRFSMLGNDGKINNHFYSWNIGPVHIIAFSTEFYFYLQYGWLQIAEQYKWLEKDLQEANKPENRLKRPWIITMGHRPMYCTNNDNDDCTKNESIIRKGIPVIKAFGLEDLFYKYGVDLELWAHEHSYERLWPVYDKKVYNGSYEYPYTNPKAPVHIITGSAGCYSKHDPFKNESAVWSAFRSTDYGYTRLMVLNKTHMYLEQVSDDKGGAIIDSLMLIKDKHGPEAWS